MRKQDQKQIAATRAAFFQNPASDLSQVRETVAKSWLRSWKKKLSPRQADFTRAEKGRHPAACVAERRPILFDYIFRCMEDLYTSNDFSSMVLLLTDPDGQIISRYGREQDLQQLAQAGLRENCTLREETAGTNAIGTALYIREPVCIRQNEHYHDNLCPFISYAAPVFDHKYELVAVIGVLSMCAQETPMLLSLLTSVAGSIGKEVTVYHQTIRCRIQEKHIDTLINTMNHGVVFLDHQGMIIQTNSVARYFFLMYEYELIGQHISSFISPEDVDFSTLTNDVYGVDVVVHSGEVKKFRFSASVYLIKIAEGQRDFLLILRRSQVKEGVALASSDLKVKWCFNDIVGTSPALTETLNLARIASKTNCTVLVTGESGTGKELVAQAIHNESKCRSGPFVAVNCGAIPKELIESELFGYESGAFTGAKKNGMPGKFELADGGTIFLDEIGDMSYNLQVCLLRFLQEQEITRIGGKTPIRLNVRVIAATNKNLEEAINNGVFRMDLYYRLNVFTIHVPPLRERTGDVHNLSHYFLQKYKSASNQVLLGFTPEALSCLTSYSWPGNIRELENTIERAVILSRGDQIRLDDLPDKLRFNHVPYPSPSILTLEEPSQANQPELIPMNREEIEKNTIIRALQRANGNVTRAAEEIGISRRTIYRKMKKFQIM